MKKLVVGFALMLLLTACGDSIKTGKTYTLIDSIIVAETIEDYDALWEEAAETGVIRTGGPIDMIFDEDVIKVVKREKDGMLLIEVVEGFDEGTQWWIHEEDLAYSLFE